MNRRGDRNKTRSVKVGEGRVTRLGRPTRKVEQFVTVLIVTNGKKTEQDYLNGLVASELLDRLVRTPKIVFDNRSPGALVDRAVRERARNGFDLVFAISDKDNFEIESALRKADRRYIPLIISNPCFEAWLVFHFEDCRSPLSCPKDAKTRLRRHVPDYDKTALRFADFEKGILDAAARTRAHGGDITVNPTSTMWRLIDELQRTKVTG